MQGQLQNCFPPQIPQQCGRKSLKVEAVKGRGMKEILAFTESLSPSPFGVKTRRLGLHSTAEQKHE